MKASTFLLLGSCVVSVSAYICPANSAATYSPEEYFGDCECNENWEKDGAACTPSPTPSPTPAPAPESTPSPTPAPDTEKYDGSKKSCIGVAPWDSAAMGVWCNANCNHAWPYCPESHCSCSGGTRRLSETSERHTRFLTVANTFEKCKEDGKFGKKGYDAADPAQRTMCEMYEKMDSYGNDNGKVTLADWRTYIGASNKAIDHNSCDEIFLKVAGDTQNVAYCEATANKKDCIIGQEEFKAFWETPGSYTSSSASKSSFVFSTGAVAGCIVAAVGAGIGIGYFAKGRDSSAAASAKEQEMRVVLSQDDLEL